MLKSAVLFAIVFVGTAGRPAAPECPCFMGFWMTPNGLGHRLAEAIAGWQMADELGCEYLFDHVGFERGSVHGGYAGVAEFLGVGANLRNWHDVREQIEREVVLHEWPTAPIDPQCATLYKPRDTQICRFKNRVTTWCTYGVEWDRHKWRLRAQFRAHNPWMRLSYARSRALSVAWHLRVGDIAPDRDNREFFENVHAAIDRVAREARVRVTVHFVFKGRSDERFPSEYAVVDRVVCAGAWQCRLHTDLNVTESLRALMSADVLVTSRSSFSYVAALYTSGLVLFETPKEECERCYWVSEYMRVDKRGHLFEPEEFAARLWRVLDKKATKTRGKLPE